MEEQLSKNYKTISKVLEYLDHNSKEHINLKKVATDLNINVASLQKSVTDWSNSSFKVFVQNTSIQYLKKTLTDTQPFLVDKVTNTTLLEINKMTKEELKNNGINLRISYNFYHTFFGEILIASTHKGVCYTGYFEHENTGLSTLKNRFLNAIFIQKTDEYQKSILQFYSKNCKITEKIKLHINGTDFQMNVWRALLKIPLGSLATYGNIATCIEKPSAVRAVGTAIGKNPIAYLIPCHRVVQSTGKLGGYMWGTTRKLAMIGWELSKLSPQNDPS